MVDKAAVANHELNKATRAVMRANEAFISLQKVSTMFRGKSPEEFFHLLGIRFDRGLLTAQDNTALTSPNIVILSKSLNRLGIENPTNHPDLMEGNCPKLPQWDLICDQAGMPMLANTKETQDILAADVEVFDLHVRAI